jgi:hypothetical protein
MPWADLFGPFGAESMSLYSSNRTLFVPSLSASGFTSTRLESRKPSAMFQEINKTIDSVFSLAITEWRCLTSQLCYSCDQNMSQNGSFVGLVFRERVAELGSPDHDA